MSNVRIQCPAVLDRDTGRELVETLRRQPVEKGGQVVLDFSGTESMDSLGGAWLVEAADVARKREVTVELEGQQGHVADLLDVLGPALYAPPIVPPPRFGPLSYVGDLAYTYGAESRQFYTLCVDALYWTLIAPLEGRGFRWGKFFDEAHEMGVRAVRIVCLMNFLLGLIIAMLMAKQAELYGMQLFVADLVMIGFARELGAIMTAVVVSARTGAAIAAEIATMRVQEEIDALRGMGISPAQYLVALLVTLPCLVALGIVSGIIGGAVWGLVVLDFQASVWYEQTINAAYMTDLLQGFLKTFVFAIFIVLIGCHNGFRVTGGSRGVGLMTTRSVVQDIFMLITVDIIFAVVFYYVWQ